MPSVFHRASIRGLILSTLLACLCAPSGASAQGHAVVVSLTALDSEKHAFTALRKEDIRVTYDDAPQDVIKLERVTESPLSLIIMLDASISQVRTLPLAKRTAGALLDMLARPGKDLTGVMSFGSEATLEQGLTLELERARRRMEAVRVEDELSVSLGGPTANPQNTTMGGSAIWDAVWLASGDVLGEDGGSRRRAIILISDGTDTGSIKKMSEAIDEAIKNSVTVFAIGAGNTDYGGITKGDLRKITERTGGRAFFPKKFEEVRAIAAEIEQELRSQYLITFSPANSKRSGVVHKIKIDLANAELRKQELRLSYQQGYFR
jgi:Ca-activated chloride channel family protein